MPAPEIPASAFLSPAIRLSGVVDQGMVAFFRQQCATLPTDGIVVIELSTLGGDPEVARVMGEDVRALSDAFPARRMVFLGKAAVYSAGTTFMSFFARANRFLARGTRLLVHERQMIRTLTIDGPLTSCVPVVQAVLNELTSSIAIQNEGFGNLIVGSKVKLEDVIGRAASNWYVEANEALELGLIQGVL